MGQDKAVAGVGRYRTAHHSRLVPLPVFAFRPGLIAETQQFAAEPTLLFVQLLTSSVYVVRRGSHLQRNLTSLCNPLTQRQVKEPRRNKITQLHVK